MAAGAASQEDVERALSLQAGGDGERLGEILVAHGRVTPRALAQALAAQAELPFVDLAPVPQEVADLVPLDIQVQHRLVPFRLDTSAREPVLLVAMADPLALGIIEDLAVQLGHGVKVHVASSDQIEALHAAIQGHMDPAFVAPPSSPAIPTAPLAPPPSAEPPAVPPAIAPMVPGLVPAGSPKSAAEPKAEARRALVPPAPAGAASPAARPRGATPAEVRVAVPASVPVASPAADNPLARVALPAWLESPGAGAPPAARALTDRELLERLEALARGDGAGGGAGPVLAALVRTLLRRGLLTEDELRRELGGT